MRIGRDCAMMIIMVMDEVDDRDDDGQSKRRGQFALTIQTDRQILMREGSGNRSNRMEKRDL